MSEILDEVRKRARALWEAEGILDEEIAVTARVLSTEEAIGNPEGDDFPLQQGRERLMEAVFRGSRGQAFTDRYGDFSARLKDIVDMPLANNFRRAVFVASLNAVMRSLGRAEGTVHCRDAGPKDCAGRMAEHFSAARPGARVGMVGFQPAMVQALGAAMDLRVVDMDPDNIGQVRRGTLVEGPEATGDVLDWADMLAVTGTTLANGTIDQFLNAGKPVVFFGTTIAGAAALMGWERFCACSE